MGSIEGEKGAERRLLLLVILASCVPAVLAQAPAANPDNPDVTMQILVDPDTKSPDEIVRKIPPPKPRRAGQAADGSTKDLANPNSNGGSEEVPGTAADPVIPDPVSQPDPIRPDPVGPSNPGGSGPVGTPPAREPPPAPEPRGPARQPPGQQPGGPPGHQPNGPPGRQPGGPPGQQPRDPDPRRPDQPRHEPRGPNPPGHEPPRPTPPERPRRP